MLFLSNVLNKHQKLLPKSEKSAFFPGQTEISKDFFANLFTNKTVIIRPFTWKNICLVNVFLVQIVYKHRESLTPK